jgi:hypothetical protein
MHSARSVAIPLPANLRLSRTDYSTPGLEGGHMKLVTYAPVVGSLMYAMVATRSNIVHTVGIVSRFIHNPRRPHWNVVKHIFRYLVGTQDYSIKFEPNEPLGSVGFTESDYARVVSTPRNRHLDISSDSEAPFRGGRNYKIVRLWR